MLAEKRTAKRAGFFGVFTDASQRGGAGTGNRRRSVADPDAIRRIQTKDRGGAGGAWVRQNPEASLIRHLLENRANRSIYDAEGQTASPDAGSRS